MIQKYLTVYPLRFKLQFLYSLPILLVSIRLMLGHGKSVMLNWQLRCLNKQSYMPSIYLIMKLRLLVNIRSLFLSLRDSSKVLMKHNSRPLNKRKCSLSDW
ncbi:hypothetical protein CF127_05250 [Aeromonas veronii]|nr:hypothetical protein CF127_05250 [Aeromonas veronii]TNI53167.1 hypothetical protein CF125_13820 [Aeromonas veronii]